MGGRRVGLVARVAVSVGLLWLLVEQAGAGRLVRSLSEMRPWPLAAAFVTVVADNALRSANWRLLLAAVGDAPRTLRVFTALVVGGFFGSFLPSSLGPDAARAVALSRREEIPVEEAASSVVMLNLAGLWALGLVFLAGLVALAVVLGAPSWWPGPAAAAAVAVLAIPAALLTDRSLPRFGSDVAVLARVDRFADALERYREAPGRSAPVFGVAVANQLLAALVFWLAFRAAGASPHLLHVLALVPAITLSRLIPASVGGFGLEQGAVVVAFGWAGVESTTALAASLAVSSINLAFTAAGGGLYAAEKTRALVTGPETPTDGSTRFTDWTDGGGDERPKP